MRALRLLAWGEVPRICDVPVRSPAADEVRIEVRAAGLCHSDLHVIDAHHGSLQFQPPFTLGHEVAGRVAWVGEDVQGWEIGQAAVVYAPWGCDNCERCRSGKHNYCDSRGADEPVGLGLGTDGGMAETLVVAASRLVSLGDLDPVLAAPLTDAGLTAYHAISRWRERLDAGTVAVVVGIGGLGHVAIQLLLATTASHVIAVDTRPSSLELAGRLGAHVVAAAGPDAFRAVRRSTQGRGADAVFDFVGTSDTVAFSTEVLRSNGELLLVGSGGGNLSVRKPGALPPGMRVSLPFWGSRSELVEVVRLAREGLVRVETARFPLSDHAAAFAILRGGGIQGRAVLVPG
jgi:alcohol dehydrogenase, propanol-preferring